MIRWILALAVLSGTLSASKSNAATGLNLAWNDCGAHGSYIESFACDVNTGVSVLVASFAAPAGVDSLAGVEAVIDALSESTTVPSWWQFQSAGACRQSALSVSFNAASPPTSCADYWNGQAAGGLIYTAPFSGIARRARIRVVAAVPPEQAGPVFAGTEYTAFTLTLSHAKSTGAGACPGCATSMCMLLLNVNLSQYRDPPGSGDVLLTQSLNNNLVLWQNGFFPNGCYVATRTTSWGQIQQLYR